MRQSSLIPRWGLIFLIASTLVGCYRIALREPGTDPGIPTSESLDTASAGVIMHTADAASESGCLLRYNLFRPAAPVSDAVVVLGHGFLRSKERMEGLARALAASGMTTVAMDFCNSRLWDGRHYQNGLDMRQVADAVGAGRIVYAGFSAGGLAALVAARNDSRSLGVLALDLVDDRGLGLRMAEGLGKPLIGIMGEPAACNAQGNGMPVFAASELARVRVLSGAGHCDFESPTDWLCEAVCDQPAGGSPVLRGRIVELAVDAAADLMEVSREPSVRARVMRGGVYPE
jgi:pimeloyl-ACP methyl ester carboxylesterase